MAKFVLIASGDSFWKLGETFRKSLPDPDSLQIVNAYMEQALHYVRHELPEDTDVIIARGNTARLLKSSHLSIPVVTVPIQGIELIQSIEKASKLCDEDDSQIAYVGMEDVIRSFRSFLSLLHRKIHFYPAENSRDIENSVLKARQNHIHVLIGGIYTQKLAEKNGLKCVVIESSIPSLREAYDRAVEVQKGFSLQQRKLQERMTLMNAISDGIIGINEKGKITMLNPAAENIFGCTASHTIGKSYPSLFFDQERAIINRLLLYGGKVSNHIVNIQGKEYQLDFHPLLVRQKNHGIVINIRTSAPTATPLPGLPEGKNSSFTNSFCTLTGEHPAFCTARRLAERYAAQELPVLILGETGTGKTTFARCIHNAGARKEELFLVREAALLTMEDILSAHQGTLYIRDIENLPAPMIVLLNELLDSQSILLPDHTRKTLNVRMIAASSRDLSRLLPPRLYYRLNTFLLPLPALRQRASDLPLLFDFFWKQASAGANSHASGIPDSQELCRILSGYSWPGNLRQLETLCRRLAALTSSGEPLDGSMIQNNLGDEGYYSHLFQDNYSAASLSAIPGEPQDGFVIKGNVISADELLALDRHYQGHKSALAAHLGISRSTLWRYFKALEQK